MPSDSSQAISGRANRLAGPDPFILRVNPAAANGIEERLRAAPMQFQYQTEQDARRIVRYGLFHVQPIISASVRFQPDYARQVVDVTLRNVDRFESVLLEFAPDRIDEAALEDLVKMMLGEENGFLRRAPLALIKPRVDEDTLKRLFPAAGIGPERRLHWHSWRNHFVVRCLDAGIPVHLVMQWTGHDSVSMVMHYARARSKDRLGAAEFRKMLPR